MKRNLTENIDFFFNKVIPKKLLVFIVATILIFDNKLSGDMWGFIAMIYLGTNVLQKFTKKDYNKIYQDYTEKSEF
jgi:hypothetical protein